MKPKLIAACLVCLLAVLVMAAERTPATKLIGDITYQPYRVATTAPTKLYAVTGYNSGSAQFVLIFTTLNASGAAPTNTQGASFCIPVGATQGFSFDLSYYGVDVDSVTVANSTSPTNYIAGSTNCSFQIIVAN